MSEEGHYRFEAVDRIVQMIRDSSDIYAYAAQRTSNLVGWDPEVAQARIEVDLEGWYEPGPEELPIRVLSREILEAEHQHHIWKLTYQQVVGQLVLEAAHELLQVSKSED